MSELISFNKRRTLFEAFAESQLNFVRLFGCFIVGTPSTKLINYMREPLELFMMTLFQLDKIR